MGTYDFETMNDRRGIGASKWMALQERGITDETVIPLSVADMEFHCAPCITDAIIEAARKGEYGYSNATPEYLAAVVNWVQRRHGWAVQPDWIVQVAGVVPAIHVALAAYTQPGDGVLIQTPVYYPFRRSAEAAGCKVVENPLKRTETGYEMDFADLEEKAARPEVKLMLLCSPHNPVGRVWKRDELQRVADICKRNGVVVFADEIHCDFVYPGHTHTPFATLSPDNCVVGTAASKTFNLAGLATSNIIIPNKALRQRFVAATDRTTGFFNSYFGLTATQAAYEGGAPWLDELLTVLRGNADYVADFLHKKFPSVKVYPLEGTYLLWVDFSSLGLSQTEQEQFMLDAGLFLDEGYLFGETGAGFERINLACPRRALVWAMERLDKAAAQRGLPR